MSLKLTRSQILMIAVFLIAAIYFGFRVAANKDDGKLRASGTIEAIEVNVSPETSGKVKQVLIDEGQAAKTGDALVLLDDSLLRAQRAVASAQVDSATAGLHNAENAEATAKSQYQIILEAALVQDKNTRLKDWFSDPDIFQQPGWYYSRTEQIQAAQDQVDAAQAAITEAQARLTDTTQSLDQAVFLKAEKRLLDARMAYQIAQNVNYHAQNSATSAAPKGLFNRTHCGTDQGYFVDSARLTNQIYKCTRDPQLGDAGQTLYQAAYAELISAQNDYNALLKSRSNDAILQARADVSVAQERYYAALDFLRSLQTGEQSPTVSAAQGSLDQAQGAVEQAQSMLAQAQASLSLLDAQMAKLTIYAPMDGIVLARNVDPGEYVQPGAAALTMANLNELTITVYVPEDRYGEITLGQEVSVTVDSFPGETFSATVSSVADQAEFTPRNVQTVSGRSATVYAVKLKVSDPEGKLKLGMPADVVFTK